MEQIELKTSLLSQLLCRPNQPASCPRPGRLKIGSERPVPFDQRRDWS